MLITGLNYQGQSTQYLQNELCVMPSFQNVRRRHSCCVGCSMGIIMTRKKQCVVVLLQAQYLGAYLHSQVPFASVCSTCSGLQRGCQRKVSEHPKKSYSSLNYSSQIFLRSLKFFFHTIQQTVLKFRASKFLYSQT